MPFLLDLFCGAGGCSEGYRRAGFDQIIGVDLHPQPRYPFRFIQADALVVLGWMTTHQGRFPIDWPGGRREWLGPFDLVHASPPCQGYSSANRRYNKPHPQHIATVRNRLQQLAGVYCIENVDGAVKELQSPVRVCGGYFNLLTWRHRLFESNAPIVGTPHKHTQRNIPVYGTFDGRRLWTRTNGSELRAVRSVAEAQVALGISWTGHKRELAEAIPPAYTEYIGRQLLTHLQQKAEAVA